MSINGCERRELLGLLHSGQYRQRLRCRELHTWSDGLCGWDKLVVRRIFLITGQAGAVPAKRRVGIAVAYLFTTISC
jgi:hypothetical protein